MSQDNPNRYCYVDTCTSIDFYIDEAKLDEIWARSQRLAKCPSVRASYVVYEPGAGKEAIISVFFDPSNPVRVMLIRDGAELRIPSFGTREEAENFVRNVLPNQPGWKDNYIYSIVDTTEYEIEEDDE